MSGRLIRTFNKLLATALISSIALSAMLTTSCGQVDPERSREKDEYAECYGGLFDTTMVHTVDIKLSDADWDDLRENPTDKSKYVSDITIDGETVTNVGLSTKGNFSLYYVVADEASERYSYKINFGKNVEGQTWHGLDRLNLQNIYHDPTYMKDYVAYYVFRQMGVPAPLASYVWVTVNGVDQGLYMAVEEVNDSFIARNYDGQGCLYKPSSEEVVLDDDDLNDLDGDGNVDIDEQSFCHGADLRYIDDNIDSYTDIFDTPTSRKLEGARERIVASLKGLDVYLKGVRAGESAGESAGDLDQYLDTSAIINYFAAHNFVVNYDSYTGPMLHNYYLYEHDGRLALVPWDYNLAFGAFPYDLDLETANDVNRVVNEGIDSPLGTAPLKLRPMWAWIVESDGYRAQYHAAMQRLVTDVINSGDLEFETDSIYRMLLPYVKRDPTAFYTAEEYTTAYSNFCSFIRLRANSIARQLSGSLAPVTSEQNPADRVDASEVDLHQMGCIGE